MTTQFEFDVGQDKFQATKLDAMTQGKLLKRVLPLIPPLVPLYLAIPDKEPEATPAEGEPVAPSKKDDEPVDVAKIMKLAGPFADSLGSLKDEDFEWILNTCLANVKLLQEDKFMSFWNRQAKQCMFKDREDISIFLPIVVHVIVENLSRFFSAMVTGRHIPKKTA